ncbi:MAG: hypothetical protein ACRC20_05925 [Segniliparus sp.]|uniref:hypothetical protein n=1 Tax=Segniliparus sp. TaxID=2804064 RepID=UPI003F3D1A71
MTHAAPAPKSVAARLGGLLKSAAFGWILRAFPLLGLAWSVWRAWSRYRDRASAEQAG